MTIRSEGWWSTRPITRGTCLRQSKLGKEQGAKSKEQEQEQGQDLTLVDRKEEKIQGEREGDQFLITGHGDRKTAKRRKQIGAGRQRVGSKGKIQHWSAGKNNGFKEKEKEIDSSSLGTEIEKRRRREDRSVLVDKKEEEIQEKREGSRILVVEHKDGKMAMKRREIGVSWQRGRWDLTAARGERGRVTGLGMMEKAAAVTNDGGLMA
ncbi:hypothetical protein ACLOJK_003247 [Asimina triloba]